MTRSFTTVLVANRGEIACRVIRSARALGYRTVAVHSDADAGALHTRLADVAVRIGPAPVRESYLSVPAILAAAAASGADAVHPGYGFLSENDAFAAACEAAGLVFIGPPPSAILAMGNKAQSKRLMIAAKVPTIPGYEGEDQSEEALAREAARVGYPLLIKAAAGGGGRGMRLVHAQDEFLPSLRTARAEAENAFGSGEVLLERALVEARHVELQVFGDRHGHVVHLGERDCSIQRRHQKIVEEAPSPAVSPALRAKMGAAAVDAAKAIGYVGAGTVEFLLDQDGSFYFLEMNTRLQVEHPVTEMITGLDLVALQLRVAAGEPLPFTQEEVRLEGHAVEVRLYAEDPYGGFLPQTGRAAVFRPGIEGSVEGRVVDGRRIDHGLVEGQEVSPWYDPMLAKLVAHGRDRGEAVRRLRRLLEDTVVLGTTTNKTFLGEVLAHPVFAAGEATTRFIAAHCVPEGKDAPVAPAASDDAIALAAIALRTRDAVQPTPTFRAGSAYGLRLRDGARTVDVRVVAQDGGTFDVTVAGTTRSVEVVEQVGARVRYRVDGITRACDVLRDGATVHVDLGGAVHRLEDERTYVVRREAAGGDGRIVSPMNGRIVSVSVAVGDAVTKGTVLVVLEAMKMQHQVVSDVEGVVAEVNVKADDQVGSKKLLVRVEPTGT